MDGTTTKERINGAIDLLITIVVNEISEDLGISADRVLPAFLCSKTGQLLYDESSGLWGSGPSDIAEMFEDEYNRSVQNS